MAWKSFELDKVYLVWHNDMIILYIVDVMLGFHMKLDLKKIAIKDNLEASLRVRLWVYREWNGMIIKGMEFKNLVWIL